MGKMNAKKLMKLIENLVDKLVEAKVERLVEERIQKITPMLVEHEVNRILREEIGEVNNQPQRSTNETVEKTGNPIADEVIDESEVDNQRKQLRERFTSLIGADVSDDGHGNRTINMNSKNVNKGHQPASGGTNYIPEKGPEGQPIDTSNPNVQKVAQIMNQDFSGVVKDMQERSKKRGGQIPTGGQPAG